MNETGVLSASLTSPTHLGLKHPPSAVFPRARRDMDKVEAVDTGVDVCVGDATASTLASASAARPTLNFFFFFFFSTSSCCASNSQLR